MTLGTFAVGVYGGYFTAAQGILLMGVLGVVVPDHLQRLNAAKNLLSLVVNVVAAPTAGSAGTIPGALIGVADHLGLGDGLDDLAVHEDLALAVARGDPEVGLAGLAGAVDDAAHDGDAQRHLHAFEALRHLLGERVDALEPAPARPRAVRAIPSL